MPASHVSVGPHDVVELIARAFESLPRHSERELAVDFHDVKGEREVVRAVYHRLRQMKVEVVRERTRSDLTVKGLTTEWKVILPHQMLMPDRHDGGFRDFDRKSKDLKRLTNGEVAVLVAVIPRLWSRDHNHPRYKTFYKVADAVQFDDVTLTIAKKYARIENIDHVKHLKVVLRSRGSNVDLLVHMFSKRPKGRTEGRT